MLNTVSVFLFDEVDVVPDALVLLEVEVCELTYAICSFVNQSSKTQYLARNETK